jgi:hypothetical protein
MNQNAKRPNIAPSSTARRAIAAATLAGLVMFTATACFGNDSSQSKAQNTEQKAAADGMNALLRDQPVPNFQYSQLRQNLIELQAAQANGAVTTSFFLNMGSNDPVFQCSSIGAPIASTTELTNPQQTVSGSDTHGYGLTSIGQADPTGVYTGQSTGTYIMCVGQSGQVNPVYWEGTVLTAFGPAHWDKTAHTMVVDGPSGSKFSGIKH